MEGETGRPRRQNTNLDRRKDAGPGVWSGRGSIFPPPWYRPRPGSRLGAARTSRGPGRPSLRDRRRDLRPPPAQLSWLFFFNDTATTEIYTLSLHDALPI